MGRAWMMTVAECVPAMLLLIATCSSISVSAEECSSAHTTALLQRTASSKPHDTGSPGVPLLQELTIENRDPTGEDEFEYDTCHRPVATESTCTKTMLPSVLAIGLPFSGSTSLAQYMHAHPSLSYGSCKEHRYFVAFHNLTEDYETQFKVDCQVKLTFDGTPDTIYLGNPSVRQQCGCLTTNPEIAPAGVHAINGIKARLGSDVKIVALLRDPVTQAKDYIVNGHEPPLWRTCYADSLDSWLEVFPRSNFHFIRSEDFFADSRKTMDELFTFLGVEPYEFQDEELEASGRRRSGLSESITDGMRRQFHTKPEHRACKERLEAMTGMKFDWPGSE